MIIKNLTKNTTPAPQTKLADTFFLRLKGLLGTKTLNPGEALLLKNEKSIHTLFMAFSIDIVYIDPAFTVIDLEAEMPPNKLGRYYPQCMYILELPAGTIKATNIEVGDKLDFGYN